MMDTQRIPYPFEFNNNLRRAPRTMGFKIQCSAEAYQDAAHLAEAAREFLAVYYLTPKNEVIHREIAFIGTVDSSAVYSREIIRRALELEATSLVMLHNHPSGDPEPSACDRNITECLSFACRIMGLKFLDHVIIGAGRFFSFADQGIIADYTLRFLSLGGAFNA